jgi:hypothetical protein
MVHRTAPKTNVVSSGIRTRMIQNATSYNKHLTQIYLCFKPNEQLLCFTHPEDRRQFETELGLYKKF